MESQLEIVIMMESGIILHLAGKKILKGALQAMLMGNWLAVEIAPIMIFQTMRRRST